MKKKMVSKKELNTREPVTIIWPQNTAIFATIKLLLVENALLHVACYKYTNI